MVVYGTDTIYRDSSFMEANSWYREVSMAPLFSRAILTLNSNLSLRDFYSE
ncbi:MAG: hypothetical protein PF569_05295 [Candidatus Woesearchaeota archaeon]|nr:hypothetical protein [Candidatus Woesearchaeota archaeon]